MTKKLISLSVSFLFLISCNKTGSSSSSASEDNSASGSAAAVVGGAMSTSSSGGAIAFYGNPNPMKDLIDQGSQLIIPNALASVCPKPNNPGSACSNSGSSMWLTASNCSHNNSSAVWNGVTLMTFTPTSGSVTASCGSFPAMANGTILRQYVTSASNSTTPGIMTRTNSKGTTVNIDDATANLGNFDTGHTVTTLGNGGYGTLITVVNGVRTQLQIAKHQYVTNGYDHSVEGTLTISETSGASSRSLSGTMKVYHNKARVIGTSTFNNVQHSDTCCTPVSGSIQTIFSAGTNVSPTVVGAALIGKTETLTFTGCGTANLTAADGSSSEVTLNNCF